MRKRNLNILTCICAAATCLLIATPDVRAFSKNEQYTLQSNSSGAAGGDQILWGYDTSQKYGNAKYYTNIDGQSTNLYCLDPGVTAPKKLLYSRAIYDPQVSSRKAGDYGLIKILDAKPGDYGFNDDGYWYNVQSLAVRFYIDGYLGWGKTTNVKLHINRMSSIKKHASYLIGNSSDPGFSTSGANGKKVLDAAEKLYLVGVKAKESYNAENSIKVTVSSAGEVVKMDNNVPYTGDSTNGVITETKETLKIVEINLVGFDKEKGNFTLDSLEVTSGSSNFQAEIVGVSFQNTKNWEDYSTPVSLGTNIFDQFSSHVTESGSDKKNLRFYVAIKTTTTVQINMEAEDTEEVCEKGTAKLKYSYEDPESYSGAVLYGSHDGKTVDNEQRFVFITKTKQKVEGVYDKIEDSTCASFDPCNPAICVGDDCEYNETLPQICEDGMEVDEDENAEYKFLEAYQEGKYAIKKCLLKGKKDAADNSYKLVDRNNASVVADNPYCSIMCKEDYIFKLPYKRHPEEARYFSIGMTLKGQQDCYSTSIDYDQYNKDILDQTAIIMSAYNEWAEYYELVNSTPTTDDTDDTITCYIATCDWVEGKGEEKGHCSTGTEENDSMKQGHIDFEKLDGIKYFTSSSIGPIQLSDGTLYYPSLDTSTLKVPAKRIYGSIDKDTGYCSDCSETGYKCNKTTPKQDYDKLLSGYKTRLNNAKRNLENQVERLKEIIDELNSCVGDHNYNAYSKKFAGSAFWDMVYKFNPEIKYSYDEPNPTDSTNPKWIEEVKNITCDGTICDTMFSKDQEIQAEFCASGTNCTTVASDGKVKSIFSTEDNKKEVNVNTYCIGDIDIDYTCKGTKFYTLDANTYETKDQLVCEIKDGIFVCSKKPFKQTKVNYLHKTAVASGTYDTRRVYYTRAGSGDVRVDNPDLDIANYSVVKGLPIGANTPQGTYFYILAINNIGTFYSSGELGRIYSSNPRSLSEYARSIAASNGGSYQNEVKITVDNVNEVTKQIGSNEYACSYDVSQNSCTDPSTGKTHLIDECHFGKDYPEDQRDKDWDACKKRLCGSTNGGGICIKTAEGYHSCTTEYYSKETCTPPFSDRQAAIAATAKNYNCCPNCDVVCVGRCLIVIENDEPNDAKLQVDFRTITTANINPNSRRLGYNWDSNNGSNYLVAQKAGNTISEIEARASGQASYPEAVTISDYVLKVTMTPDMVTWIKKYNNEHIDDGSYSNDTLECYDYTLNNIRDEDTCEKAGYIWQNNNKCIMANVFCYSKFIDDLEASFSQNVDAPNRASAKNSAHSNFQTYKQVSSGVDTSGTNIKTNDYWTIYEYTTLDVNGDGIPDIGPSWK